MPFMYSMPQDGHLYIGDDESTAPEGAVGIQIPDGDLAKKWWEKIAYFCAGCPSYGQHYWHEEVESVRGKDAPAEDTIFYQRILWAAVKAADEGNWEEVRWKLHFYRSAFIKSPDQSY